MAWDGSGNFTRTKDWTNDRDAGTKILASRHDENDDELTTGIATSLTKNNESKPTADFKPNADASYSLGSSALRWLYAWLSAIKVKTSTYIATIQSTNLTASRTQELPDKAGTFAMTSDIPAAARSYLAGCEMANGTDATNDIDFSAGSCANSTNAVMITCAAMAGKQLDVGWAAGAAAGMRNSAAAITDTTYHIYAVAKADGTQDYYAHTSTTVATVIAALQAESGGSAYLYARRIGSIIRSGATILAFLQNGDTFDLKTTVASFATTAPGTNALTKALAVPTGIVVRAMLNAQAACGATIFYYYVSSLAQTDEAPSATVHTVALAYASDFAASYVTVTTDTSASIRARVSASDASVVIKGQTLGWIDRRGRDA